MRNRLPSLACALVAVAVACSDQAPPLDGEQATAVQAHAFAVVCLEVLCPGAPILALDTTTNDLRDAIRDGFTDEVEYVAENSLGARTGDDGRFVDGALLITPGEAYATDAELVAVDVGLSKGVHDFVGRTDLFEWDGEQWINVSADSVGITVTSAVS